jgi:6-phosphogluconolactonase
VTITRFATSDEMTDAATRLVAGLAGRAVADRGRFTIALSGGSTPQGLYRRLAAPPWSRDLPWAEIDVFFGDERSVPPDDPASNFGQARETLLDRVALAPDRIHRIRGEQAPADAARIYQAGLARTLNVDPGGPAPALDLMLLGLGADGHTASLFPDTAAVDERRAWFTAGRSPDAPHDRVTATVPLIVAARRILMMVVGGAKAAAVAAVVAGPPDPRGVPGQFAITDHTDLFIDAPAARRLDAGRGARCPA